MDNEKIPRSTSVNSLKELFESRAASPISYASTSNSQVEIQNEAAKPSLARPKSTENIRFKTGASKVSNHVANFESQSSVPSQRLNSEQKNRAPNDASNPFEENPFDDPIESNSCGAREASYSPPVPAKEFPLTPPAPPPKNAPPSIAQPSPAFLSASGGSIAASSESIVVGSDLVSLPVIPPPLPDRPPLPPRGTSTSALDLPLSNPVSPVIGARRSISAAAPAVSKQLVTPDASLGNRRLPTLDDAQLTELPQRAAVKAVALCKSKLCTLQGNTLRIWKLQTGECTRSLTFGEVKLTSVVFCPSAQAEDEGARVWVGFERGELFAVDIETGATVEQNHRAHTAAVSHLVRQGAQIWSLDDNGSLLIWHETGNGNFVTLGVRPRFLRVAPKPMASCVAGDYLWLSYGRGLEVYAPCGGGGNALVKKVDLASIAGPCTCFAYHSTANMVYSGHDDGRILVWDVESNQRCGSIVLAASRVTSLAVCANRYLWVGLTTGRIYVYDVTSHNDQAVDSAHWTVNKLWDAHSASAIAQLIVDPLSLIAFGKLVVVSLAENGAVRFWDGLLLRDWEDQELRRQRSDFCSNHYLKVLVSSWNIDASRPIDLEETGNDAFLQRWLTLASGSVPDIIVVGLQEIVDLESTTVNARSLLIKSSTKTSGKLSIENRAQLWKDRLSRAVRELYPQSGDNSNVAGIRCGQFRLLECRHMMGLFSAVFVRQDLLGQTQSVSTNAGGGSTSKLELSDPQVREVAVSVVKTGLGGLHGNKGAIATRLVIDDTSFCFVNCHLAAHQNQVAARNHDVSTILRDAFFAIPPSRIGELAFVNGGDGTLISDHSHVIWFGDLNYRIDLSRDDVFHLVQSKNYTELMRHDQLRKQLAQNPLFMLRGFHEAPTLFDPTFKYDTVPPFDYDTSEKKRVPAYCDRILWRGDIEQHTYQRYEVNISDHRPVNASFTAVVNSAIPAARDTIKRQIARKRSQYVEGKIQRAKAEYLMDNFVRPLLTSTGRDTSPMDLASHRDAILQVLRESSFQLGPAKDKLLYNLSKGS